MTLANYSDRELILHTDNLPNATDLERELANRLVRMLDLERKWGDGRDDSTPEEPVL